MDKSRVANTKWRWILDPRESQTLDSMIRFIWEVSINSIQDDNE